MHMHVAYRHARARGVRGAETAQHVAEVPNERSERGAALHEALHLLPKHGLTVEVSKSVSKSVSQSVSK